MMLVLMLMKEAELRREKMTINQWVDLISDISVFLFCMSGTAFFIFGAKITQRKLGRVD